MKNLILISLTLLSLVTSCNSNNNEGDKQEGLSSEIEKKEVIVASEYFIDTAVIDREEIEMISKLKEKFEMVEKDVTVAKFKDKEGGMIKEKPQEVIIEDQDMRKVEEISFHDHAQLDVLLKEYVNSIGVVDYKGLKTEQSKLNAYLDLLTNIIPDETWSRNEKLAYWINLYNASTLRLIVNNYPIGSITNLDKPWDQKKYNLWE